MAYKYCTDCGSRVEYIGSLPKFCSDCGVTLASGSVKRVVKGSIASRNVSLEDDETDIHFVPRIDSLQFDVEPFAQKTFKLEGHLLNLKFQRKPTTKYWGYLVNGFKK